ncbi:hypothetical protein [Granulosicoccus antarcticus]|uniref:Uncharacterized protein n=1 Tax=Granulosicoccus antarcticus IMCC3135 TaxID=1192854 RepID=A0A2Z2NV44_9GAMM|nr:hypothetical protein [Granulosicoccus antarcticus]ASJ73891.1 hypothetical protein IMCC3135_19060 [Granulosicoccus antarcticus IMCC3135]
MFGFFKRCKPVTLELDSATIEAMFDEVNLPDEREYERISEHVADLLDTLKVDINNRKFVWKNGTALGITELTQHIHNAEPAMAVDEVDMCITHWLEEAYCPEGISEGQMEKLQVKIENWIEDHQNEREAM